MALAVALSAVGVGPLLLLGSFRRMSTLSLLGFVSSASVVLATCWLLYLDPHRSGMPVQVSMHAGAHPPCLQLACLCYQHGAAQRDRARALVHLPCLRSRRRGTGW